ncbi:universal stress protein [Thermocoleostomius sinensis]|uniref:Universal stress protein n=1 Tax=Thermocoleostomius sinensis A174 TaxID=2016057 RepID=A0A9E8ZED5_9CYAN|nr:universal stress protein [Thermocoleostomius sinensis]WAL60344.1 universal stress protein [Thermocoleostomius sinensis A174]
MFKQILVALDGSELSQQVVQALEQIRVEPDTQVVLAHVLVTVGANPDVAADRPQTDLELIPRQQLETLQRYQDRLPCKSRLEIVTGDPAEEIVRLANIYHTDLIVIGSRGLTGLNRILKGSVSSQVVEDAACSVMVVKPFSVTSSGSVS